MATKWVKTAHRGLRYHEHPTRRHGKKRDRYYAVRFRCDHELHEYGIGWWSDGIPEEARRNDPDMGFEEYAISRLKLYKANAKTGTGPKSPKETRVIATARREQAEAEKIRAEKENVTFHDFMTNTYLPQSKLDKQEKTYKSEEMLYRLHLAGTIGPLPFGKISPFHLERIKKDMSEKAHGKQKNRKLSDRTIQYALQITRHVFNTARKLGIYAGESPTKAVKWPKLDNMKLRYLSITEAETLLAALAVKSQKLHDLSMLSLHCGLRFGELAKLTWSCVNWDAGTLAVLDAKTGSRTAYLTAPAKAMLQVRKKSQEAAAKKVGKEVAPDELIFPKRSGKDGIMDQSSKVFTDTVKELKFNLGVTDRKQKVTFHTLRHSFATHLYESTHDLYLTQRSLGHATSTMTARYAKMSESRLREGAAALEKAFIENAAKRTEQLVNFSK
jgi:integrase